MAPRDSEDLLINWLERLESKIDLVISDKAADRVAIESRLTALESGRSVKQNVILAVSSIATGVSAWLLSR